MMMMMTEKRRMMIEGDVVVVVVVVENAVSTTYKDILNINVSRFHDSPPDSGQETRRLC